MDEKRRIAPITPGSAEGEREPDNQSQRPDSGRTPGSAEGERPADRDKSREAKR
jgi:hypothetical protein